MKSQKLWLYVGALILVTAVVFGACYSGRDGAQTGKKFKIGAVLPLTGNFAVLGVPERQGIELGVERANQQLKEANVPVSFEAVFEDTQGDPKNAVSATQKLLRDGVNTLVVSTTGASRAVLPVAVSAKVPVISLCLDPTIHRESPLVFRLYEDMGQEANVLLSYFEQLENKEAVRVGFLYANISAMVQQSNDFLKPGFQKLGINFAYEESYQVGQKDFKDLAAKARASNLTHLIITGYGFEYPGIFRDFKSNGVNAQIMGGWGFVAINSLSPDERNGVIVATPSYLLDSSQTATDFQKDFAARFGAPPNFDAAFSYNSILMLREAVQKVSPSTDGDKIAEALSQIQNFNSIFGATKMDERGDMSVPMTLAKWSAGKLESIK